LSPGLRQVCRRIVVARERVGLCARGSGRVGHEWNIASVRVARKPNPTYGQSVIAVTGVRRVRLPSCLCPREDSAVYL
jgi:hypothetical protein